MSRTVVITNAQRGKAFADRLTKRINKFWRKYGTAPDYMLISGNSYMHLVAHVSRLVPPADLRFYMETINFPEEFMGVKILTGETNRITFGMTDARKWAPRFDT